MKRLLAVLALVLCTACNDDNTGVPTHVSDDKRFCRDLQSLAATRAESTAVLTAAPHKDAEYTCGERLAETGR